ncbi:MAG: single-stranded DNA-binding protein [Candidatus Cloacimonadaceae bacterium]|nr:single-stranded DNA-binding protein [Candidatus Cloacimonadaceae bacterium]
MADLKLPRLNKVFISGRITADIELKYTPKGTAVVRITVAMDKRWKDDTDTWQQAPIFVNVVVWHNAAELLAKQAHKGSAVLVEGRIETSSYVDNNNINRKVFEIIAENVQTLEWKPKTEGGQDDESVPLPEEHSAPATPGTTDDVPF